MNIIASVNAIYTQTIWNLNDMDEENRVNVTDFGFSIDKIIVHTEPSDGLTEQYNYADSSTNADKILDVQLIFF